MGRAQEQAIVEESSHLLAEARLLLGHEPSRGESAVEEAAVLVLYERLRERLLALDAAQLEQLLGRVARNIEDLEEIGRQVRTLRLLHKFLVSA